MRILSLYVLAASLCALLVIEAAAAVGGRGGGGGFSRGGAAAGGGFSGGGGGAGAAGQRPSQLPATPQRDLSGARDSASQIQNSRASSSSNVTINSSGGCNRANCSDWDNGRAAAAVVGGAIAAGSVMAAQNAGATSAAAAGMPPASGTLAPPCNVPPVDVSGVQYYKCGVTWYSAGYASNGVVYLQVAPPPGY